MKTLKSYAKQLDSKSIPHFLAEVSDNKAPGLPSGEFTISLYEVLAGERRRAPAATQRVLGLGEQEKHASGRPSLGYRMTIIDFIDVNDDTIDLSSDEETVEQDHNATQQAVFVLGGEEKQDEQAVFVLAGQERQDEQAAFVSAGKGSQEATESGKSLVATASPSVMEKVSLDTAEPKNCPNSATSAPLPTTKLQVVKAGEESQEATESGNSLVATASPSVMEKVSLDTAEPKNCPNSPTSAPLPSPTSTTPKALTSEVADTQLVATQSPSVMENAPFDTSESKNCTISPTTAPLPSPASTTPKTVTSEVGDTKLVRLKNPKKYYTSASRRSRSFEQKRECCDSPVEEPAADHKRSRMVDAAEESAYSADHAESAETLSTDSTN